MKPDRETYRAASYASDRVAKRYVQRFMGEYKVVECLPLADDNWLSKVGAGATLREYLTEGRDIPETIRAEARKRFDERRIPNAVEWPLTPAKSAEIDG